MIELAILAVLLVFGMTAGRMAERSHYRSIVEREQAMASILLTTSRRAPEAGEQPAPPTLVFGEAVISTDYFKTFISGLKKLVGGSIRSLETLPDRARREAMLRMMRQAQDLGYDAVCNVRIEGLNPSGPTKQSGGVITVGAVAFGTAYRRRA